jgi:hypothetical protein
VLAPETVARLKSPLDFVQADDEPEVIAETLAPAASASLKAGHQPIHQDRSSEEAEMPRKATGVSPKAAKSSSLEKTAPPRTRTPLKGTHLKTGTSPRAGEQQSLGLSDDASVENIRRANLHVLTSRNGSKARLGVVMALTGSNMAHRLHGKKRMDDAEANRFTERLGLPIGWLDTPRSEADIPESVARLLTPASRGRASAQQQQPPATAEKENAETEVVIENARAGGTATNDESLQVPKTVAIEEALAARQHQHADEATAELANHPFGESDASRPASLELPSPAAVPQRNPAPHAVTPVTSLDSLEGIEPIAEALIKTLAGKARTGRLNELKALELLQQAVLL